MLRPLETLDLPSETINNLAKKGFLFVEDVFNSPEEAAKLVDTEMIKDLIKPKIAVTALEKWQEELQYEFLSTASEKLNGILEGGFQCSTVTELFGGSGSGKTQICFQACLSVQLSQRLGGLKGKSLYIDTRNGFSSERLLDLINGCTKEHPTSSFCPEKMLKNIIVVPIGNEDDLLKFVIQVKKDLHITHDLSLIKVIIIDSLSFVVLSTEDSLTRTQYYAKIMSELIEITQKHKIPIIIVNELSSKFGENDEIYFSSSGGQSVSVRCHKRLMLGRIGDCKFAAKLVKSPTLPEVKCSFYVTKDGIRDKAD